MTTTATTATDQPPTNFLKCCTGTWMNYAFVRKHWDPVGTQCMEGNGPDLKLFNCPLCGTTKAIEVECSHGGKP